MQVEQDIPSSALVRVYLLGPLEVYQRDQSGAWKLVAKDKWKNSKPARAVFKRLLVQPGRRLARSTIEDDIWSESDNFELTTKNVYNAISLIRGIIGKPLVTCWDAAYEIAGQTLIWTDLDACSALLKEAENRGQGRVQAIPFLEQAVALLERGELLEGEDGKWCYAFRKQAEDMFRQAHLWLAESYEAEGKLWQAGEQYRAVILTNPSDEDALQHWITMLHRQGKRQEAIKCYRDMQEFVEEQGFTLSSPIEQFVASLEEQSTIPDQSLEAQNVGLSRRNFVQSILEATGIALLPETIYLDLETLDRLSKVLQPPSHLDEMTIAHLETVTRDRRYEFVQLEGRTWNELFQEMSGHLRVITRLLETHRHHSRLRTIAGETTLLLGDLLFNAGENSAAERYYQAALATCDEEKSSLLRSVILGRQAFIPIYEGHPEKALPLLNEARQVAPITAADLIVSWLWAITAEAYANVGNAAACFQALDEARRLLERGRTGEVVLSFRPEVAPALFSLAKFSSFQGVCLLRLNRSEAAQEALSNQLMHAEKQGQIHHKSIALTDLALSFVQRAAIRQAYTYAIDALSCVEQTRSVRVFQRILNVRQALYPWENTSYVKNLDEQMRGTARCLAKGTL
jgi:DNA-binding SARP family transcriptional activator